MPPAARSVDSVTDAGRTLRVEVWSDVVCPWCFIGKRRVERAIAALHGDPSFPCAVELVYRPFQLDPRARRGVTEPVVDAYARKFGGPQQALAMIERITAVAAAEGIEFRLDRALRGNTADAHRLLWWALDQRGPAVQAVLKESLMTSYFTDGDDIGDVGVLVDRAVRAGLDRDQARDLLVTERGVEALAVGLQRAADLGITAVPTYVVDQRWSIPGAQDPAVFEQVFRRLGAPRDEPVPT
jgi:predicted DsbA family dithiol-disulfide isomerase